jgi:hypothetical protein
MDICYLKFIVQIKKPMLQEYHTCTTSLVIDDIETDHQTKDEILTN